MQMITEVAAEQNRQIVMMPRVRVDGPRSSVHEMVKK